MTGSVWCRLKGESSRAGAAVGKHFTSVGVAGGGGASNCGSGRPHLHCVGQAVSLEVYPEDA